MTPSRRNILVGRRFAEAAARYDEHADVQRVTACRLAERIARLPLPVRPRILEIGCGTGLLTQELASRLGNADWTITDIAQPMLDMARRRLTLPGTAHYAQMDGEHPSLPSEAAYDLICSSLAMQWFTDLGSGLARLCALLAPGGHLAIATLADGTFFEWRRAHEELGLSAATPPYPPPAAIGANLPGMRGGVQTEYLPQTHSSGLHFLHSLKHIGATSPAAGSRPLATPALRRVIRRFEEQGASVTYHLAYGIWRKSATHPQGVFVTGTDTGIGKTLVSAVLARAWNADYWKPFQTGVAEEPGDTETIARLAELSSERLHAPACVLQAPLSPWAAAPLEGATVSAAAIALPATRRPLVVEGAGGLYVPIDDEHMMIDLIARLGLPVVLAARSTLGTINHTLLSLEALRRRNIPVLGVVMNGPLSPGNKAAIEQFGHVKVLAEIPALPHVDAGIVHEIAQGMPTLAACMEAMPNT